MHGNAAGVSLDVWLCHRTPFYSHARSIAGVWTLTPFPRLQPCQIAKQENSLCSSFCPIHLSILQDWSRAFFWYDLSYAGLSVWRWRYQLTNSGAVISVPQYYCYEYSAAPLSFSNETARIPKVHVFPQVLHSYAYMHTAISHIVFPPCYTSVFSDNFSMLSK